MGMSVMDDADEDNLTQTASAPAAVDRMAYDPEMTELRTELRLFGEALDRSSGRG